MTLSESTIKQYNSRISKLEQIAPLASIDKHFKEIDDMYPNIQTRKGVYTALLWKLDTNNPIREKVQEKFNSLKKECNQQANNQELTSNQLQNYMSHTECLTIYNKATNKLNWEDKTYTDDWLYYTILCLYVIQPPVRADYWNMSIKTCFKEDFPSLDTDLGRITYFAQNEADKAFNYCVVTETETYFIFNNYKTAKTYGQRIIQAEWIIHHLILHLRTNFNITQVLPIQSPNALVKAVKKAFTYFGGKEITIGLLRHSYIVEFYKQNPSIHKKEDLAFKMLHSRAIQECYRSENIQEDDI